MLEFTPETKRLLEEPEERLGAPFLVPPQSSRHSKERQEERLEMAQEEEMEMPT